MCPIQVQTYADVGLLHTPRAAHDRIHRRQEVQADKVVNVKRTSNQRIADDPLLDEDVLHLFRGFLRTLGMETHACNDQDKKSESDMT